MPSRLLGSIVFAGIFAIGVSSAQHGSTEVLIRRPENLYPVVIACGADGQVYFASMALAGISGSSIGNDYSLLRVSLDGSTLTFRLPDGTHADVVAPYAAGVNILSSRTKDRTTREFSRAIYHLDNQGNLLAQHSVSTDLVGAMMATTSSGTTILVGHDPLAYSEKEHWKYRGMVLDANDRIINRFELPLPPAGGTWTFGRFDRLLTAGDRAAYLVLHSKEPLAAAIATISETGTLNIRTVPDPIFDGQRQHDKWILGPGVAVEMYDLVGEHSTFHFDEYDLKSAEKIASKTAPVQAECYYGNTVARLNLSRDDFRFFIAKLQ